MRNHSAAEIQGSAAAPYINSLMRGGANFTNSHAVTYPSEPNYLALFSGSTQGIVDDNCPHSVVVPNLLNDMHSGTIAQGDAWLKAHLSGSVATPRA